jgi:nucleotide-binding universal stress UspA family protein
MAATAGALAGLACGVAVWLGSAYILYGTVSVFTTGQNLPLLAGNITSILIGAAVTLLGSIIKPENFDFRLMKQKILIVDAKIRKLMEHESDEEYLKRSSKFGYKYSMALTLVLVVAWPMPLYLSGYIFSQTVYSVWVGIAVVWASAAATIIVLLPLIESRVGIVRVLQKIGQRPYGTEQQRVYDYYDDDYRGDFFQKKILVPIDGSQQSLRALNYAATMYNSPHDRTKIYILNVIEWADENEESIDEELAAAMEEQGRRMLRSVAVPKVVRGGHERMVKLGDPATKIAEMAEKLNVDMIVMGAMGLGNTKEIGHVSSKVLKLTSIPVVFMK